MEWYLLAGVLWALAIDWAVGVIVRAVRRTATATERTAIATARTACSRSVS